MDIEKLHGTDPRLYQLVAPLVMSIPVLRYNNNYPFKTSVHHKWLVATDKGVVQGFMPIDMKSTGACIDNYYVSGSTPSLLSALIDFAKKNLQGNNLFLPFPTLEMQKPSRQTVLSFQKSGNCI